MKSKPSFVARRNISFTNTVFLVILQQYVGLDVVQERVQGRTFVDVPMPPINLDVAE